MGIKSGLDFSISWREGTHGTDCVAGKNTQHIICLLTPHSSLCSYRSSGRGTSLYLPLFRSPVSEPQGWLKVRGVLGLVLQQRQSFISVFSCFAQLSEETVGFHIYHICSIISHVESTSASSSRVEERAGCSFRLSPSHLIKPSPSGAEKCAWDMLPAPAGSRCGGSWSVPAMVPPPSVWWKYNDFDVQSAGLVGSL